MEKRSALLNFTLRIKASFLHRLCQAIADKAYEVGFEDGSEKRVCDTSRVNIDSSQIRKFDR